MLLDYEKMAMRNVYQTMALLTPPNSGKDHVAHSFDPDSAGHIDPPLFATSNDDRRRSPSEVAMMGGKRSYDDFSMTGDWRPQTISTSPNLNDLLPRAPTLNSPQQLHRSKHDSSRRRRSTSHASEALEAFAHFADRFSPAFKSWLGQDGNGPAIPLRVNYKNQTILDLAAYPELDSYFRSNEVVLKAQAVESSSRSHKRKDSGLGDYSPRKRIATPASKQRQTMAHSRKRSTHSESHISKVDNKATRMPAQKPPVSKDFRDWFDFAPSRGTLDNQLAMAIAKIDGATNNKFKDLTTDPNRKELYAAELEAAKRLNIDCGKYLAVKRAVFNGYVKHLLYKHNKRDLTANEVNQGLKSWNKTAAQQTCSIDVNTVSRLFGKFWEKLGWFDEQHYQEYISNADDVSFPEFDREGRLTKAGGFEA